MSASIFKLIRSKKLSAIGATTFWVATVLSFACASNAQSYNAETVLKRIYHLSEFPDTSRTPQTYSLRGTAVHAGLSGGFVTLYDKDNGYVNTLDLGVFSVSQGFDGAEGWESNFNGIVNDITRLNEDLLVVGRILESKEYLSASTGAIKRECLGPAEFENRGVYKFRFSTHAGVTSDVFIDSLSGDVLGMQMQYDFVEANAVFSDFREVDGFSFAFHSELTANLTELNTIAQITHCEVNRSLQTGAFSRPATNTSNVSFPVGVDSIVTPLEYVQGHLYFRMSLNGSEPLLFVLDSGAGSMVIDAYNAEALGLDLVGAQPGLGIAGTAEFQFTSIAEMSLAGIVFQNQNVGALSFGTGLRSALRGATGVVGYDFLARFVVTVDYAHGQMIIYPPAKDIASSAKGDVAFDDITIVPLGFFANVPVVPVRINDVAGDLLLDIGSSYGPLLHEAFIRANSLEDLPERGSPNDKGYVGGVGGSLATKTVTITNFGVGTLSISNQPAWIIDGSAGIAASKLLAGNLGNGFLDKYKVTLDYPHRRLILHHPARD